MPTKRKKPGKVSAVPMLTSIPDPTTIAEKHHSIPTLGSHDIWTTQAGERLQYSDMDENHIINSIRILERRAIMIQMGKNSIIRHSKPRRIGSIKTWLKEVNPKYFRLIAEARARSIDTTMTKAHITRLTSDIRKKADLILDGRPSEMPGSNNSTPVAFSAEKREGVIPAIVLDILATAYDNSIIDKGTITKWEGVTPHTANSLLLGTSTKPLVQRITKSVDAMSVITHRKKGDMDHNDR